VGAILSEQHLIPPVKEAQPVRELVIQVDGGHIPIQDKTKRSFEALSAIVYRPESLKVVTSQRNHHKSCALSKMTS